jgi:hypothetical protein
MKKLNGTFDSNNIKYGQIAGNRHINELIYYCFEYICEEDEKKFVKKFREQPNDSDQVMHTFRELVLGGYLGSMGLRVKHELLVDTKTPDWCILDEKSEVAGLVELTNFQIDKTTELEIEDQLRNRGIALFWRDENKDNVDRLYQSMVHKAEVYGVLAQKLKVPYVIAVFADFQAAIDSEEIRRCLFSQEFRLFEIYPEVSGVLYFLETSGHYLFRFIRNPIALREFDLPDGFFPRKIR